MIIELFTLIVLAGAVAVKFLTSRHTESLELEKTEVDNDHRTLRSRHNQVFEARKEAEDRLRMFERDKADLERHLKEAEEELEERIQRNEELEEN
jgi:hypothetical protein